MIARLPDETFEPFAALDSPIESPSPVVSYPSNWEVAALESEQSLGPTTEQETSLSWHSAEPVPADESPTLVFSKEDGASGYPVELQPTYALESPIESPPFNPYAVYEVPPMLNAPTDTVCNCVTYPCDCDEPPMMPTQPPPIVTPPVLPIDEPVTTPPPIVTVNVGTQTPTTQHAVNDGETAMIFGYPWYYVAGAAAAALFLFSSMDGKH